MTKREMFEKIIAVVEDAEIKAFAESEIEKMNARNEKRKAQPSKVALANAPLKEKIHEYLYGEEGKTHTASEIAEVVGISTQKASALCRQMAEEGIFSVEDVKVKGKGKVKGYKLV